MEQVETFEPSLLNFIFENAKKAWAARSPTGIVSKRYKFIYFPVPKAASSTLKVAIARLEGIPTDGNPHGLPFTSVPSAKLDDYPGYQRFTVMRNPWERLVSCFKDKVRAQLDTPHSGASRGLHPGFERYNRIMRRQLFAADMSFEKFVEVVSRIPDALADEHFRSQYRLFTDSRGHTLVSRILRFESLGEELNAFFGELGIARIDLPQIQSTIGGPLDDFYTDRLRQIVGRRYRRDIEIHRDL